MLGGFVILYLYLTLLLEFIFLPLEGPLSNALSGLGSLIFEENEG
jgi:hypothetical protein